MPLAVPRAMLPGGGRLQFPTPEAATRAPAVAWSWLGPQSELLRGTGWPADDAENRARVWENSLSELSQCRRWSQASLLATFLPARKKKKGETNEEQAGSNINWKQALRVYLGCHHWLWCDLSLPAPIFPICQCTSSHVFLTERLSETILFCSQKSALNILGKDSL